MSKHNIITLAYLGLFILGKYP